jgi:hypothetical protein
MEWGVNARGDWRGGRGCMQREKVEEERALGARADREEEEWSWDCGRRPWWLLGRGEARAEGGGHGKEVEGSWW